MTGERRWEGVVAHLELPTVDGRVLQSLHWALPLPVFASARTPDLPGAVGVIDEVEVRDETDLWAAGRILDDDLPGGRHVVGIEISEVDMTIVEGHQQIDGRLRLLRLYTGTSLRPAWTDVAIEVAA